MRNSIFLITIIVLANCSDDKTINACNSPAPLDIPWLAELKESMTNCSPCELSIFKGTFEGTTVIFIATTDSRCNTIETPTLYNCEGIEIRSFTDSATDQQ